MYSFCIDVYKRQVCNRTGANLDSGVATALLHAREADWGVFECDELWLAKILPHLQADYVLLLNLFRDQLDRVGEIDRIQEKMCIRDRLGSDRIMTMDKNNFPAVFSASRLKDGNKETGQPSFLD